MKRMVLILTMLLCGPVLSADHGPSDIEVISMLENGVIQFVLTDDGREFKCLGNTVWLQIGQCPPDASQCIATTNRLGGLLLSSKLAGKQVSIDHSGCDVKRISIR